MNEDVLGELVGVWEYWTQGDPLLRQAWERVAEPGTRGRVVLDQIIARLDMLALGPARQDRGTTAAALAGWAVLYALESDAQALDGDWYRMSRFALRAHKQALEEREQSTDCPSYAESGTRAPCEPSKVYSGVGKVSQLSGKDR